MRVTELETRHRGYGRGHRGPVQQPTAKQPRNISAAGILACALELYLRKDCF